MKKLTVVIVSYNVKYYLEQCLKSLAKALEGIDAEVVVVDNHSADGSVEYLSPRFPTVRFISSLHNLGFARANNKAIRTTESEFVLLLNPDTLLTATVVKDTLCLMEAHPDAGACGVRMMQANGRDARESRRGLPTLMTAFYKFSGLCRLFPRHRRFGRYYMGYLPWDKPAEIEVISGAYCLLRRKALDKVGLLDEDFFMYGEDIDLSFRLLKGGFHNWYAPSRILHYKGESTVKSSFGYVHVFYEAMHIFFRKHYKNYHLLFSLPIRLAIYVKATLALVSITLEQTRKRLGFIDRSAGREPKYYFIGTPDSLASGHQMAHDHALDMTFVEASQADWKGHQELVGTPPHLTFVVYDLSVFDLDHIFGYFYSHPKDNVLIGTYDPELNKVITIKDILP